MSGGEDPCTSGEAVKDKISEFTEKEVLDSAAVQWFGGLLDFIEVFWYENAELNEIPPQDVKLNGILGYIPMEIAFISSWLGEQLANWESSVSQELIADVQSSVLLATSVIMICQRFIEVCKEVAEKREESPSVVPGSADKQVDQAMEQSTSMEYEWKTYQLLPSSESTNTEYLTYENVKEILENVESYCKEQEKLIMGNFFGEKPSNREYPATGEQSPSGKDQAKSCGDSSRATNDEEIFKELIKNTASFFSSTETSHERSSYEKKRRLKRLAYAQPKRVPSDNKEFDTLILESKCAASATPCATQATDNDEHSAKIAASSGVSSSNTSEDESLGIRIFNVYEAESEDHVLLSVPADHTLEWGNEAEAPRELLLFIRMQNCAIETWEMITEANIGNQTLMSDSDKEIIKLVFDSLYKNLQVLKACLGIAKSSHHSKVSLLRQGLSLKTESRTNTETSESQSDEDSNPKCSRTMLSHTHGIRKGSLSLLKCASVKVRKEGESVQLIAQVPAVTETSTTASEAGSEEETEQNPKEQS